MNFTFYIFHSSLQRVKPSRREGFTLIEILVVISVMAILGTITLGTSRILIQTSRERRAKITRDTLNVALHRYRTEYQEWPVSRDDVGTRKGDYRKGTKAYNGYYWYEWKTDNYKVLNALRASGNEAGIRFIDESAVYVKNGDKVQTLAEAGSNNSQPYCYAMKRDNKPAPFLVWICFDTDEAEVGPRDDAMQTGATDDEDAKYGN